MDENPIAPNVVGFDPKYTYLLIIQGNAKNRAEFLPSVEDLADVLRKSGIKAVIAMMPEKLTLKTFRTEDIGGLLDSLIKLTEEVKRLRVTQEALASDVIDG